MRGTGNRGGEEERRALLLENKDKQGDDNLGLTCR